MVAHWPTSATPTRRQGGRRRGGQLGGIDIVLANAGIGIMDASADPRRAFRDQLDVNLVGVWNTVQAAAPLLIEQKRGGAVVLTSSALGSPDAAATARADGRLRREQARRRRADAHLRHLARAARHPRQLREPDRRRHAMVLNPAVEALFGGGSEPPSEHKPVDDVATCSRALVQLGDITAAVAFLASDEARYITGVAFPVDAGMLVR